MPNYKKVRFISWEVYSAPSTVPLDPLEAVSNATPSNPQKKQKVATTTPPPSTTPNANIKGSPYPGYADPFVDIAVRVAFTEDAITKALAEVKKQEGTSGGSDTLKVFMAPEFLYRGVAGAYTHDYINGWDGTVPDSLKNNPAYAKFPGLFGMLKKLVATDDYKDWVFIFGTAISSSWIVGDDTKMTAAPSTPGNADVLNTALVQLGGAANGAVNYAVQKHFTSHIDFSNMVNGDVLTMKNVNMGQETPLVPIVSFKVEGVEVTPTEGSASFQLAGLNGSDGKAITFGLEICLDHANSATVGQPVVPSHSSNPQTTYQGEKVGRLKTANKKVQLQLVTSGGLEIFTQSLSLDTTRPDAYAFNCDGHYSSAVDYAKTQVYDKTSKPLYKGTAKSVDPNSLQNVVIQVTASKEVNVTDNSGKSFEMTVNATDLWTNGAAIEGAGQVRVLTPVNL